MSRRIFNFSMLYNFFTLDKNKNELIIAGRIAIAAITSTPPIIAIPPYATPKVIAPESPGNTLLGKFMIFVKMLMMKMLNKDKLFLLHNFEL